WAVFCDSSNVRVFWRVEPAKYRYPLAVVDFRSKTSLVTYLARSLYRLGSTARCPPASPSRMAVLREKRLFGTHFSSSFTAGHGKSQTRLSHALPVPGALRKRDY